MRELHFDLRLLLEDDRQGSYGSRRARRYVLAQAAETLHQIGYRGLRAKGLKGRHIKALVAERRRQGLAEGTVKNRMAHLRWWAGQVGKANLVGSNAQYGIGPRSHVSDGTKRREVAIKFTPSYADRGDRLSVRGSTAKGGRPREREVPVLTDSQRRLLDEARELAGGGALIPPGRNYAEQRKVYEDQTRAAGLDHMHGLRHAFALDRYEDLAGWKAPAAGGPRRRDLDDVRRGIDTAARLKIASELGHSRLEIARVYLAA